MTISPSLSLKIVLAEWRTGGGDYLLVYRDASSGLEEVVAGANRIAIRGPADLEFVRGELFRKAFERRTERPRMRR